MCCLWSGFCLATHILQRCLSWKLLPPGHFPDICSSNKTPAGSELLPPTVDGGHRAHWDLQRGRHLSVPFPRSVPPDNPVSDVYRQFLLLRAQFVPPHAPSTIGPSWRGGVGEQGTIPIHVQSTEFTTGWLQLSCRNISRMILGSKKHPSVIAKAANTYIHMISYSFVFNEFANKLFHFLIMGFCPERKGGGSRWTVYSTVDTRAFMHVDFVLWKESAPLVYIAFCVHWPAILRHTVHTASLRFASEMMKSP